MSNEYPSSTRVLQKKPSESAFKQQKLPAWQPILTASTVLPTFFVIGIAFIPIGIGILIFSDKVQEIVIDYTYCKATNSSRAESCAEILENGRPSECLCSVNFTLDTDYTGNVYMYYGLTNFYQNHRRYVKSRDDVQLLGRLSKEVSTDCKPYDYEPDGVTPIAPCGAIANSMFNDELELSFVPSPESTGIKIPLIRTGIAWPSDKEIKFRNPDGANLQEAFRGYAKPRDWKKNIWELDLDDPSNNGFKNEDFIVWMRTAALPNFRKLYRRIDHKDNFKDGLPRGSYILHVKYNYRVIGFKGTKSMILSTTSILGAKNPFLGYAYITVGSLCLTVGVMFLLIHIKYGKSTAEVVNVTPTTSYQ